MAAALSCFSVRPVIVLMLRHGRYHKDKRSNRKGRSGPFAGVTDGGRRKSREKCEPPDVISSLLAALFRHRHRRGRAARPWHSRSEIGIGACRERVCQYV